MPAAGAAIDAAIWAGLPPAASACMTADAVGAILPTTGFAADAICIAPDVSAPASGDDPADSATPTLPGISFMGPLAFLFLVTATHAARFYCTACRSEMIISKLTFAGICFFEFFRDLRNSIRQYNGIGANRYFPLDICLFCGGDNLSLQTSGAIITARLTPVHTFN
ncbi:hypothetical protein [Burkholderia territorii]|uniref:hypothetical protein n=1 Tax=Burkholderia territorii TaxID=1503055 RepID=UPI0018C60553|nr:hypothetical protein [Burkholderia territorii]